MDDKKQVRVVRYTTRAEQDHADIYEYSAFFWGVDQAENYIHMLLTEARRLTEIPSLAKPLERQPEFSYSFTKWKNASNGHHVVVEFTDEEVVVL